MAGRTHPDGFARSNHAAGAVARHHAPDTFGGHVLHPRGHPDDTAIVDQRAKAAEFVSSLKQADNIRLLADVAFHGDGLALAGLDGGDDLARGDFVAGITDANPKSAGSRGDRSGAADPATAAGDDCNLVHQTCPRSTAARTD